MVAPLFVAIMIALADVVKRPADLLFAVGVGARGIVEGNPGVVCPPQDAHRLLHRRALSGSTPNDVRVTTDPCFAKYGGFYSILLLTMTNPMINVRKGCPQLLNPGQLV